MKSIQAKLIAAVVIVLVVTLGSAALLSGYIASSMILAQVEESLPGLAGSSANDVGQWLEGRKSEMQVLANNPYIVNGQKEEIIPYINSEAVRMKVFDFIFVSDAKGDYYTSEGKSGNIADRPYFKQAAATMQVQVSEPVVSKSTGKTTVNVVAPLQKEGRFAGVVTGVITVDKLSDRVEAIKFAKTGYAFLVQGDGKVIAHPNKQLVMELNLLAGDKISPELKSAASKMIKGERGFTQYSFEGTEKYVGYAPVPGTNWSMAINAPVDEMTGHLKKLNMVNAATPVAAIIVAAILMSLMLTRIVVQPVRQLEKLMAVTGEGDLRQRGKAHDGDEIGRLLKSFNHMLDGQESVVKAIQTTAVELSAGSEEMAASSEQVAGSMSEIARNAESLVEETRSARVMVIDSSSVLVHLSSLIQIAKDKAASAADGTVTVKDAASKGRSAIAELIGKMGNIRDGSIQTEQLIATLSDYTNQIETITNTITNIANQTNLLALNAAIEAARAGEQGRGFAVVAEEVRKLAEQSNLEAAQVTEIVGKIAEATRSAVISMQSSRSEIESGGIAAEQTGEALENIITVVMNSVKDIEGIASVTGEQVATSDRVVQIIDSIAIGIEKPGETAQTIVAATQEIAAAMENIATSTAEVSGMAQDLKNRVEKFKIS